MNEHLQAKLNLKAPIVIIGKPRLVLLLMLLFFKSFYDDKILITLISTKDVLAFKI